MREEVTETFSVSVVCYVRNIRNCEEVYLFQRQKWPGKDKIQQYFQNLILLNSKVRSGRFHFNGHTIGFFPKVKPPFETLSFTP